jgi:glucosamine 6-phosphate synthetase-like amidotransferase/phosphosugar isomerase protein
MCCLFGLLDYEHQLTLKQRQIILQTLSIVCEDRGTDATGISYFTHNRLYIQKAPRAAHKMRLHVSQDARYIMGHTRMTTQGDEKKNYNNHPFSGKVGKQSFALAHNGILHNDKSLRISRHLPASRIETDSYVAVQLLEKEKNLGFKSLRHMAEALDGTFTITVLSNQNDLYIVKGNNPMCLYQFETDGFYLYASTQEILDKAVQRLHLDNHDFRRIYVQSGEILRIAADGFVQRGQFNDSALWPTSIYSAWGWPSGYTAQDTEKEACEEMLHMYSQISGYDLELLEYLHSTGFSLLDIEQMVYDPALMEECVAEVLCE